MNNRTKPAIPIKKHSFNENHSIFFGLDARSQRLMLTGLIVFFFLLTLNTLFLAYYLYQPEISTFVVNLIAGSDPSPSSQSILPITSETPIKTPSCGYSNLKIGSTVWQIESVQRATDGTVNIPDDTPGVIYWIQDRTSIYTFVLSPTQANLDLFANLQAGLVALLTTPDCDVVQFSLSAPQTGEPSQEQLVSLPASSILLYIPNSSRAPGQFIQGSLSEVIITSLDNTDPSPANLNLDISHLSITIPSGGTHLQVVVSILNKEITAITISSSDFILIPEGAYPSDMIQSYPSLPLRINPDEMITFNLVFPLPSAPTATLEIFSRPFILSGY